MSGWDKVQGGLVGLLVGDALGVPYEFHEPSEIPPAAQLQYVPPPGFERAHPGVPPGTWSDDGAQALCLLASLLERGRFEAEDFGQRLVAWQHEGYLAVDGDVFDVGVTTSKAITAIRCGRPAETAGPSDAYANGNGSLMRVLPLVLWHRGDDRGLVEDAFAQSRVTHGHLRAQACCGLYCLWARSELEGVRDAWAAAVARFRALFSEEAPVRAELEFNLRPDETIEGRGSGYVIDALRSARQVLGEPDFGAVVRAAIRLGRDTDTTACIAGGIAGIRWGIGGIPEDLRDGLRGGDLLEPILERLRAHVG